MESSSNFFCNYLMFNILIMLLPLSLHVYPQKAFSYPCLDHESSALLQFKQSFFIDETDSGYSKVSFWNSSKDCCSWDGIDCDEDTGHVIGLDLSSSLLHGSINSNSTLFQLVQLQSLNLANNDFNESELPSGLVNLSKLIYLNLSDSFFYGEVPKEISHLSMLSSLDLSGNSNDLTLNGFNFKSLILNLTNIEHLVLRAVNLSAVTIIPEILANLSSLTTLDMADCELYGEFPGRVFNLPKLKHLDLSYNSDLGGYLPEFHSSNTLNHLRMASTSISGMLPASLGKLSQLVELDLSGCNNLSGRIPSTIGNLSQLIVLSLSSSNLSGHMPSSIGNLSLLTTLQLSSNKLEGQIPSSFYHLKNLESLYLTGNRLSGMVDLDMFLLLKNLSYLSLSDNNLLVVSGSTSSNTNTTVAQLKALELESCNLTKFSEFLRNQTKLSTLRLSNNYIQGLIPIWVFNMSIETEGRLELSDNSLTGFDQSAVLFNPNSKLQTIYLYNNKLKGSLPIPPPSILEYDVSNNGLEGEVSPLFCNLTSLGSFYLSDNSLSGKLPPCLVNWNSIFYLQLERNQFRGTIPDIWTNECNIRAMLLSDNQFEGELPRSLANCTWLDTLDVGNNQIKDTFPLWMETLPELSILVLQFNKFSGAIRDPDHQNKTAIFPKLHIVDLSHNSFSGPLPRGYFQKWDAMKVFVEDESNYFVKITITNKGTAREYWEIQNSLNMLDLSNNKFEGEIPELIGILKGLTSLYLSNNFLTGHIPSSLGNLSKLEVLDLAHNKLSGEIPQQLTQLNFLGTFTVAHNNLVGPIPRGKQFDTFPNSSYEGNAGLCGKPLSEECGNLKDSPPPSSIVEEEEEEKGSALEFGWKPVVIGYGCGLVIGIAVGHFVIDWKYYWFFQIFRIRPPK